MIDHIKTIMEIQVFDNTLLRYCVAIITFGSSMLVLLLLKRILVRYLGALATKTRTLVDDFCVSLLAQIGMPVITVVSLYIACVPLTLPDIIRTYIKYALIVIITLRLIVLMQEIMKYSVLKMYSKKLQNNDPSAEAMAKSVAGILKWVIWGMGLVFILDNLGINISALVAGIGIGGIAVAMASQAVLGDAFSAFSIFLDKPFEIGDFIIVDDMMGTIEHIGIKTTRLRSLSGEQLICANTDLTKSRIKNYKRMETRRIAFRIGVVYQTPCETVKHIPELIKDLFKSITGVRLDRVHFAEFGASALLFEVVYYVLSADYNVYMDKQQIINIAIMELFGKKQIEFAYPTQTLYLQKGTVSI